MSPEIIVKTTEYTKMKAEKSISKIGDMGDLLTDQVRHNACI